MSNDTFGNRTGRWFWEMIDSLGLSHMTDGRFNRYEADDIIERFMTYKYRPDGRGGLFTVPGRTDMHQMDIWYQMCAYLNSIMCKEGD